ncbi:hypothetical protein EB796_013012 [Bugula neritina]|uniref:Uncharacterized protein n=1 Tax=Bugula neritina TaxID=10212 RepID=A0A7J7JSR9_BUGNE|nr:hypothetical protein EB796_013012 [Bugula neritina]
MLKTKLKLSSQRNANLNTLLHSSLDRISDDSDALFDETAELLKSVASELRTYESYSDDEDEFFVYSKEAVDRSANSILAKYQNLEAGLQSVLEEESEGSEDMSSPKRLPSHSPGERVFSSPKVKKFLQLQSFSNTISPSLTPPETKRDSNLESEAHFLLEEGQLSVGHGGQLVVDNNLNLSNDLSQLPEHALDSLTVSRLSSHSSSPKPGGLVVGPLAL